MFDADTRLSLEKCDEVMALDLAVTKNCGQEARTQGLT